MKSRSTVFAAGLTMMTVGLVSAAPASADCGVSQKEFKNEIVTGKLRGEHFGKIINDMRALREAAAVLQKYGRDDACAEVVSAMREIAEKPPQNMALRKVSELGGKIRVQEILNAEIRDKDNVYIGSVENVIVDAGGGPGFLIVEHGGFLGLGEEQTAIPFKALQISPDRSAYFLNITEKQFGDAPRFKRDEVDWAADPNWRGQVNDYYGVSKDKSKS